MPAPTVVGTPVANRYGDLSVTVPAGANHLLVGAGFANGGAAQTETATYNGVSMTQVVEANDSNFSNQILFGLANPATTTANVVIGPAGAANRSALALSGVAASSIYGTPNSAIGTGTTPAVTITVGADGLAVATLRFGGTGTTVTAGSGETVRVQYLEDGGGVAILTKPGTGSVSFAPTLSNSTGWQIAAVSVNGVAGATPTVSGIAPTSGPVGTQITITGTNLTGTSAVSINGTACTGIINDSATQVRATIASGTTTGALALTATAGSVTGGPTFTVTATPVLTSLEITNPNTEYALGVTLSPITIRARDQFGATWLGAIADATVSALTLPVTVTGTLTRPFVSGIATFNDLVPTSAAPAGSFSSWYLAQLRAADLIP
jgi:hypothetical protein